ncbi:hypothetical protein N431DRAFT_504374 [Stipitochalara longipes BDJ]|nr:hypothetical protein N431DRAFT_504374 [Stipitochalara longipes BDJ]
MPPFGFVPFGFSARECVSVCLLIKDCVVALDSSRGSATEYREVIRELWALEHALCEVVSLAEGFETTAELNALVGSAKRVADQCKECIEGFLKRVKKYEKSLGACIHPSGGTAGTAATGHRLRGVTGKLSWALFMKEDLARFRAEINAHSSYINMILITASISFTKLNDKDLRDRLDENQQSLQHQFESTKDTNDEKSEEQLALLGQLNHTLAEQTRRLEAQGNTTTRLAERMKYFMGLGTELKAFMRRIWMLSFRSYNILLDLQRRVPPEFEKCWIQEPLILTDAIGRVAPVHLELINSWEVLESVLAARFRNIPGGERKIEDKEYALQDRKSLKDLERNVPFEACFMPGGYVDMAMIFQGGQIRGNSCPACGKGSEYGQSVAVIWCGLFSVVQVVAYGFSV